MKLFLSLAAASISTLGLSGSPQTAFATSHLATAFSAPTETRLPIRKVAGYDGYGFGLSGQGCGWGNGGGTGYDGCFIYEKGDRGRYGYRGYDGYGYAKPYYGRRGHSRGGYGRGRRYRRGR